MDRLAGRTNLDPPRRKSSRRWTWTLGTLFLFAWAIRFVFLRRLASSPLADALSPDAKVYWDWATALLGHGFRSENPFFMGPLYPYVMACLRACLGDSIAAVLHVQALWGAAATVALADAAKHLTNSKTGLAVGILVASYEMAVLFDGLIVTESLLFFLEALLLWWIVRTPWSTTRPEAIPVAGALIGVLAQGRATAALLLLPLALLIVRKGDPLIRTLRNFGLVVASFSIVCAPAALHNLVTSGEWIPFTYNLGYNFYVGNNPQATGSFVVVTGDFETGATGDQVMDGAMEADGRDYLRAVAGLDLTPAASSAYWTGKALTHIARDPWRTFRLTVQKLAMLWNVREYYQLDSVHAYRSSVGVIGLPFIGFAALGMFALAGLHAASRLGARGKFIIGYLIVTTLAVAPFFVTDRYRHHLVPALALLAAVAWFEIGSVLRARDASRFPGLAVALTMGVLLVNIPLPGFDQARLTWDKSSTLGDSWLEKNRPDLALRHYADAIAIENSGGIRLSSTPTARIARASLRQNCGRALMQLGRNDEAVSQLEVAHRLAPGAHTIAYDLAEARAVSGSVDNPRAMFEELGIPRADAARELVRRAWEASRSGRPHVVETLLWSALQINPQEHGAWVALVRLETEQGRSAEAMRTLHSARDAGLDQATFLAHQALIEVDRGNFENARLCLRRIPRGAESDPELIQVIEYVRSRMDTP